VFNEDPLIRRERKLARSMPTQVLGLVKAWMSSSGSVSGITVTVDKKGWFVSRDGDSSQKEMGCFGGRQRSRAKLKKVNKLNNMRQVGEYKEAGHSSQN
jgi:hypothetical protein